MFLQHKSHAFLPIAGGPDDLNPFGTKQLTKLKLSDAFVFDNHRTLAEKRSDTL